MAKVTTNDASSVLATAKPAQLKKDASFGSSLSQSNETILIGASEVRR